jgi:hypothetical protein
MRAAAVDISSELQAHNLRAGHAAATCSACRRRLLVGEILYVYEGGDALCALCSSRLPEERRTPLRSQRVGTAPRALAVVPRAA